MNLGEGDYTLFYKYQPVNAHSLDNLKRSQIYFHNPCKHNDPFDSKISCHTEYTEKQWIKRCMQIHNTNESIAKDLLKYNIEKGKLHRKGKLIISDVSDIEDSAPLASCFSKEKDNILMWSHYADHHKGICLSFKAKNGTRTEGFKHATEYRLTVNSEQLPLYHIKYEKEKPRSVNLNELDQKENFETFLDFLLTKSPCWEYEKEYRLISIDNKNIKYFKKEELEGIILGLKINYFDAYMVYNIIEKNYLDKDIPINFYKAEEKENEYAIEINKIKNIEEYIETLNDNI